MNYQASINEQSLKVIKLPFFTSISIFSTLIAIVVSVIDYVSNQQFSYITAMALAYVPSCIMVAYIPIYVRTRLVEFASKSAHLVDLPSPQIQSWWHTEISCLFSLKDWLISISTLGVIGPFIFVYQTKWWSWPYKWFSTHILEWSVFFAILFFVYWGNEFFTVLIKLPRTLSRFGGLPIRHPIHLDPDIGLVALGGIMFRTSMLAIASYSIFTTVAFSFTPLGAVVGLEILLVFVFFGLTILLVFFSSLYNIHVVMVRYKYNEMRKIALRLWKTIQKIDLEPSPSNIEMAVNLQQIYNNMADTAEWPFKRSQLTSLLIATVSPIVLIVVDRITSYYIP